MQQTLGSTPDYRWNAVPSPDRISVVGAAACWAPAVDGPDQRSMAARLAVTVHVSEPGKAARVWLDVYAFDADGALVNFDTHDLQRAGTSDGGGELFALDDEVWGSRLASSGTPPSAAPRRLKYRVYVRPEAGLFTDGRLHELRLPKKPSRRASRASARAAG